MVDFIQKDCYNIEDLISIIRLLRAPGGCPWDAKQTHESIKKNLIEETYEVIEAVNKDDKVLLCEELGDLLMQIVFHAQMESEAGVFGFDEVADGVCKKLVERHPHVFGEVTVNGVEDVLTNWDAIKKKTKGQKTTSESMFSVPRELPALMRAAKLQKKAADIGFDWPEISGALDKLEEEIAELRAAIANKDSANINEEFGDLLFSAVNVSRFIKVDAEESLTAASDKFLARFTEVEKLANERGIDMKNSSLEQLDALWDEVKARSKN
ncbi:MAG: nucleoside triphosphate pyrophosphohydrolase [Clostridia bacterium]|nr:nucleoside triphosphate pyrophosphohydrolase [Clostridia bacterium]